MTIAIIILGLIIAVAGIAFLFAVINDEIAAAKKLKEYDEKYNEMYIRKIEYGNTPEAARAAAISYFGERAKYESKHDFKLLKRKGVAIIIGGIIAVILGASIVIIPTGYTGVRTTLGQIDEKPVATGFNMKIPFVQSVKKVNNKQQEYISNEDTQFWAETKARTAVYYQNVTVTYTINPEYSAWIYANISNYKDTLITESLIGSALKTASKTLADEEATSRGVIEKLTAEELQKSLNEKYQNEVVKINKITIANADFDETYTNAIAQKQAAQLAYEKQAIENKKAIEKAEAEAEAKKIKAQGNADAAIIAAEGEKKANDTLNASLNDTIIKNKAVDKWNGELPKVTNGGGVLIDITE